MNAPHLIQCSCSLDKRALQVHIDWIPCEVVCVRLLDGVVNRGSLHVDVWLRDGVALCGFCQRKIYICIFYCLLARYLRG